MKRASRVMNGALLAQRGTLLTEELSSAHTDANFTSFQSKGIGSFHEPTTKVNFGILITTDLLK